MLSIKNIRNFSIIAHIDHGKSTLSDRLIEFCNAVSSREMREQILDSMDIERERGITIKSQTVRLNYNYEGENLILNLMDTPGHVDFGYEVSRCLAACEGCLLLVDATQGVEAQTLANLHKAKDANLEIIPVINKVDLPSADIEGCKKQIKEILKIDGDNAVLTSGKTGFGIKELLESIAILIPPPEGSIDNPPKALLVDAWYDAYLGVIMLVRIVDGSFKKGDRIKMIHTKSTHLIEKIGIFSPKKVDAESLSAGEVGFICCNMKQVADCSIGDTIIAATDNQTLPLPGFKKTKPVVYCGLYPTSADDYNVMREAMEKLALNDSSLDYEYETSSTLGFGFKCGFLGLLHMEIVQERLEREFNIDMVITSPSVIYNIALRSGEKISIHNASIFPDPSLIDKIEEPVAKVTIFTPDKYMGDILVLCLDKRGVQQDINYTGDDKVTIVFHIPLMEIMLDFHDRLKSISQGYASFEWELYGYQESDVVKVNILVNGDPVDALSILTHREKAENRGRGLCLKLKELIPRQMFAVPIQAAIGGKIIARETVAAMRKDVTAKCYGGDITRKRKLLEKQKEGKKRMKMLGSVEIPQKAFLAILKIDE